MSPLETSSLGSESAAAILLQLQIEQYAHDEKSHPEISRLCTQHRLRHMTLHFAKYAGHLAATDEDGSSVQRLATDVLVIALSSANILGFSLAEAFGVEKCHAATDLHELGRRLTSDTLKAATTFTDFCRNLSISAGKLAAAAEKLDHLEDHPFRPSFREGTIAIAMSALQFHAAKNWDAAELVRARLDSVKKKHFLYGKI